MEENKIEGNSSQPGNHHRHHHDKCCHEGCCRGAAHHFIKAIMIIFVAILLLCIGAAIGARRESHYKNFSNFYGNDGRQGGCPYMMRDNNSIPAQGAQFFEIRGAEGNFPTMMTIPGTAVSGTSTPTAPQR